MRVGDFGVEVVGQGGATRELESGHVLARPGQVYLLRLRNFGPLYCVVQVDIDGACVTGGGLALEPWGTTELERPIHAAEDGRFTVIAEGDEAVFGPDGGRDNSALGLIEARFRRELPRHDRRVESSPIVGFPELPSPTPGRDAPRLPSRFPVAPPEWSPSHNRLGGTIGFSAIDSTHGAVRSPSRPTATRQDDAIERAAGTGLTGHSDQQFVPIQLGPLEAEATVIQLRIVIGTEAAIAHEDVRPLVERHAPLRPAPRP